MRDRVSKLRADRLSRPTTAIAAQLSCVNRSKQYRRRSRQWQWWSNDFAGVLESYDRKERTCFPEERLNSDSCAERVAGKALIETFMSTRGTLNIDRAASIHLANQHRTRWLQYHPVFAPNVPVSDDIHNDSVYRSTDVCANGISVYVGWWRNFSQLTKCRAYVLIQRSRFFIMDLYQVNQLSCLRWFVCKLKLHFGVSLIQYTANTRSVSSQWSLRRPLQPHCL